MNISVFASAGDVYVNCECIHDNAFIIAVVWAKCALLSVIRIGFWPMCDSNYTSVYRMERLLPHSLPT